MLKIILTLIQNPYDTMGKVDIYSTTFNCKLNRKIVKGYKQVVHRNSQIYENIVTIILK